MADRFMIADEETLRRVANIIGPQSAAARALACLERARADRDTTAVILAGHRSFRVCSRRFAEIAARVGQ